MGGLEISNKFLRCSKCLEIKRFTIKPEYPEPKLLTNCRCSEKEENLAQCFKELKKKEDFKIKCAKCQTEDPKEPKYCYQCQKIYCSKCSSEYHSQLSNLVSDEQKEKKDDINEIIGHKVIDIEKVDFHCILHQNEKFIGFCKKCLVNFCVECQAQKLHEGHDIKLFVNLIIDKKKKEYIKEYKKCCHTKISYNHKVSKMIRKKIKNKDNKNQIETLSKENEKINEKILEFFEFLYDIYDKLKHKDNYSIIYNVVNNLKFNIERLKFDKDKNEEEDALILIDYLKNDFIMHNEYSLKKLEEKKNEKNKDKDKDKDKEDNEWEFIEKKIPSTPQDDQLGEEKYNDSDGEEEKKEEEKKEENKNEIKEEPKNEEKKEEKKEETKKEKKEREKREKEEKAKKEKEEKERAKKEKEEKAKKEKEDKEKAKREEKEKKEKEKKEKEEKARKEKEEKEKAKKEEKEKAKKEKEKAKKEKEEKKNKDKNKDKDKKDEKDKKDDKEKNEKEKKPNTEKRLSQPTAKIIATGASGNMADKRALFQQRMGAGMMGMGMKRPSQIGGGGNTGEKAVKIEHTRNEGDTVEIINNIQVMKVAKKKPKKINFEGEGEN